jgi:putative zinc finger protein
MAGESKNGMQCAEFDALLSTALDATLTGPKLEAFQAHARVCAACGPLFAEADGGRRWLKSLAEVEPPANLVHNILLATSGYESERVAARPQGKASWTDGITGWLRSVFGPVLSMGRQPRFAMSFGMAFFSLSISLSLAGVKVSDVRHVDMRPSAIKRTYYETTGRVVKYYENIRFVYEIESRVREFKRVTAPPEPSPKEQKNNKEKKDNNTSGQPEPRQERNYSQGEDQPVLAFIPNDPPVGTVTTYRRLS